LHDGPPYANGVVHVGHALNKVLKDLMLRSELSRGKRVQYRPGWDCHGLPIELKALQQPKTPGKQAKSSKDSPAQEAKAAAHASSKMSASEIRTAARKLASETVEVQKKSFREWGVMGEWDEPYTTMSADFETRQLGVFREMVRKGRTKALESEDEVVVLMVSCRSHFSSS
jgi:isoleucyl-tRNA synthetase